MCGITGFIDYSRQKGAPDLAAVAARMAETLSHRGPDDHGVWVDEQTGAAFGHRRLSIIDLSKEGHQPMLSYSGRYVIVFNGEIYNFRSLKKELESGDSPSCFRGQSDTEVILASVEKWGLKRAVDRFIGMFAFALWDREKRVLYIARDRAGIKPLYYGITPGAFIFGSELKALLEYPGFTGRVNPEALALYLKYGYVPAPYSIYRGLYKLLPGTILSLDPLKRDLRDSYYSFWSAESIARKDPADRAAMDDRDAVELLEQLLLEAVKLRMVSDVPVGAFLSGGIDSTLTVAMMQAQCSNPVKTFTIGFSEASYDEAGNARIIASHLGTDHYELYATPKEAMDVVPYLPGLYDEPFADPSQVPTFLVSKLARNEVKVSLSGDGGDELFGGYNHYLIARYLFARLGWIPRAIRKTMAAGFNLLPYRGWDKLFRLPGIPKGLQNKRFFGKDSLLRLADIMQFCSQPDLYSKMVCFWGAPETLFAGACYLRPDPVQIKWPGLPDLISNMMYMDLVTYLPDDILVKVDRASMGVGLEARVPLLDHRIIEFALRLPLHQRIRDGRGKWCLRQVLRRYLPEELQGGTKMGFEVPIGAWLRGPLKSWADELLNEQRLREQGFFRPQQVRRLWTEHTEGARNRQYIIWTILMFQAWLENWMDT